MKMRAYIVLEWDQPVQLGYDQMPLAAAAGALEGTLRNWRMSAGGYGGAGVGSPMRLEALTLERLAEPTPPQPDRAPGALE